MFSKKVLLKFAQALEPLRSQDVFNEFLTKTREDLLGIHRATLSRALQKLKHNGVISSFNSKKVQINNWDMLLLLASQ